MTTEQIVKALRVCGESRFCKECPSNELKDMMGVYPCADLLMMKAADLIEQQAARIAELKAKAPRWIPCSERMPSDHVGVLLWDSIDNTTFTGHYSGSGGWDVDGFNDGTFYFEITHWMPLPEAPEEVKK